MGYKIREIDAERKFCEEMSLDALTSAIPLSEIEAVLTQARATEQRHRRLTMIAIVLLVIALHIYSRLSIGQVFKCESRVKTEQIERCCQLAITVNEQSFTGTNFGSILNVGFFQEPIEK